VRRHYGLNNEAISVVVERVGVAAVDVHRHKVAPIRADPRRKPAPQCPSQNFHPEVAVGIFQDLIRRLLDLICRQLDLACHRRNRIYQTPLQAICLVPVQAHAQALTRDLGKTHDQIPLPALIPTCRIPVPEACQGVESLNPINQLPNQLHDQALGPTALHQDQAWTTYLRDLQPVLPARLSLRLVLVVMAIMVLVESIAPMSIHQWLGLP
jgi:hypothetical protein